MFRLLIVDDEFHVVESMAATIPWKELGIETVYKAFSGFEAIDLLTTTHVDIIITDIQMPGMTGLELIRKVREQLKKTKCILLSGHAEFEYAREAILQETEEYLLKPVTDEELIQAVKRVLDKLNAEWAEIISHQQMVQILNEHLPLIQDNLLNDLLQGRRFDYRELKDKMSMLDVPQFLGNSFAIVLIRMEGQFLEYDLSNLSLMVYAIGNMTKELFGEKFELWHCKDSHDFLVFLVKSKHGLEDQDLQGEDTRQQMLVRLSAGLQEAVKRYLKGKISVLVSRWGNFPEDLAILYRSSLSTLRRRIGNEEELFTTVENELEQVEIRSLQSLYEYPTLNHLLETGQWNGIVEKLQLIFEEFTQKWSESQEHLLEVYFTISASFAYIAHKNGRQLSSLSGIDYDKITKGVPFHSVQQLRDWAIRMVNHLKEDMKKETKDTRASIIRQVQQFVQNNLLQDVSLLAIANQVFLHPIYVSKIYKLETGELLSNYVYRLKMDKAAYLLKYSQQKVYEIADQLGYQRTHSFIYTFKKQYGTTPQEYRNMHNEGRLS